MSKAPGDVSQYDGSGAWFKVFQLGTIPPPWNGTDSGYLVWKKNKFTFTLPAEIPAGQYLMRIEHIAVHPPYKAKQFFLQVRIATPVHNAEVLAANGDVGSALISTCRAVTPETRRLLRSSSPVDILSRTRLCSLIAGLSRSRLLLRCPVLLCGPTTSFSMPWAEWLDG
jgi:hypothetical protein